MRNVMKSLGIFDGENMHRHRSAADNRLRRSHTRCRSDTAGRVGPLMLRNRCGGVERDRIPNCLRTALPHVMRKSEGAADVRPHDLEATIRSAAARKAKVMQKHRDGNQLVIRVERAMSRQLGAIEPSAPHG